MNETHMWVLYRLCIYANVACLTGMYLPTLQELEKRKEEEAKNRGRVSFYDSSRSSGSGSGNKDLIANLVLLLGLLLFLLVANRLLDGQEL